MNRKSPQSDLPVALGRRLWDGRCRQSILAAARPGTGSPAGPVRPDAPMAFPSRPSPRTNGGDRLACF